VLAGIDEVRLRPKPQDVAEEQVGTSDEAGCLEAGHLVVCALLAGIICCVQAVSEVCEI
jgi:hypothetical protein